VPGPIVTTSLSAAWGPIRLAASRNGLVAVEQLTSVEEFDDRLTRRFGTSPAALGDPFADPAAAAHLRRAAAAFERFVAGELAALDDLPIDLADRTSWDRAVLAAVRTIRAGSTASYGDVARMVGKPGAARAVGGAVGRNPVGLVVPCHRVIAGDGTLGGYGGGWWGGRQTGLELKRTLLQREGVEVSVRAEADSGL
jgi:methylated-DNA-[protein]-cysteine S-methyltransferase